MQALDLPAGDGDLTDQVQGLLVYGRVDLGELVDQVEIGLAPLVTEDGAGWDEGGWLFGEFAGFDAGPG